jgi:hypothetical protein
MENGVFSFRVAINKGLEPRLYTYDPVQIPLGVMDARLDFKTWSKRIIAINCYFTKMDTGDKFVVTVYCHNKTGRYMLSGSTVDFGQCPVNWLYRINVATIERKGKRTILLVKAEEKMIRADRD